ncbi:MAG: hypothetical protein K2J01_04575 [Clostridiales bacterium]|nr:hypothetical protein [Clostridiales bacterium]
MKKKKAAAILAAVMGLSMAGMLVACGNNTTPSGTTKPEQSGPSQTETTKPEQQQPQQPQVTLPTKEQVVRARQRAVESTVQGYDFNLTFKGDFSILGIGASLTGRYDGSYRYDSATDTVSFKRTTSGPLLFDSTAYVFTSGDSRVKMTMDGSAVKKLSVEIPEEQNITMINLPVVAIVDSVREANIDSVTASQDSAYAYSCPLKLDSTNPVCNVINQVFEKLGTGVSFKGIKLNASASALDFNLKDDKINDFHFKFQMEVGVKNTKVGLTVDYKQTGNTTALNVPNSANTGILYTAADIQREAGIINAAFEDLKDDPVYSLDLTAKNEFDPGWNKLATTDSYKARMYKKTDEDNNVWFNHSYCYKAHDEQDGKENYKYTLGNINGEDEDNQGVWLISRKGTNTQTKVTDVVTADTQFDFLTNMVKPDASKIDCIKKQVKGTETVYKIYLGKDGTANVQKKIVDMINTNPYDSVITVNNYFNTEYLIKDADIEVTLKDGKIDSVKCDTKLCYTPTGGEYDEYNITLDNIIELTANKNLDKANKYTIPTKVKGNVLGWGKNLNDSEYYIL